VFVEERDNMPQSHNKASPRIDGYNMEEAYFTAWEPSVIVVHDDRSNQSLAKSGW
jgi:hypothetical protein